MKGVIVYKGRYGATEQYANWLGNILQLPVFKVAELSDSKLNEYDYVIAGTSVYVGKMLLAGWINSHQKILAGKKLVLFVVCATTSTEEAQLNDLLRKNINKDLIKTSKVFYLRGRMIKSRLSFIDRIVLHMGAALQKNKLDKERMLADFDDVRQENLTDIVTAVRSFSLEIGQPV